jgi:solute:Na+ symporter, SSS family
MGLTSIDWIIMAVYSVFVLGIGVALKRYMKTSSDFFFAGRSIPAWVCGLAFISANLVLVLEWIVNNDRQAIPGSVAPLP